MERTELFEKFVQDENMNQICIDDALYIKVVEDKFPGIISILKQDVYSDCYNYDNTYSRSGVWKPQYIGFVFDGKFYDNIEGLKIVLEAAKKIEQKFINNEIENVLVTDEMLDDFAKGYSKETQRDYFNGVEKYEIDSRFTVDSFSCSDIFMFLSDPEKFEDHFLKIDKNKDSFLIRAKSLKVRQVLLDSFKDNENLNQRKMLVAELKELRDKKVKMVKISVFNKYFGSVKLDDLIRVICNSFSFNLCYEFKLSEKENISLKEYMKQHDICSIEFEHIDYIMYRNKIVWEREQR